MLKIAVCDDEKYFRMKIKSIILKYMTTRNYDCVVDCYKSGEEIFANCSNKIDYDMVFLDINMKKMDGIATAQEIRRLSTDVYIIFITAYITYSLEGYKVDAVRYILKEDSNLVSTMQECLDTVIKKMNYEEMQYTIDFSNEKVNLAVDRILYVESRLHKVIFFVIGNRIEEYCMYDKLDCIENNFKQFGFCRTHQSFLVNMKYVKSVERYKVVLLNGIEVSISKKYYKDTEMKYIKMRGDF
ncbi:MAG: response regulator transcription factor [Lachnospiraceae bacterium]|nr:response regulator transcription factor [Lachnospiraceae bacterium]